jgi:RND superfamily putative drug exporter
VTFSLGGDVVDQAETPYGGPTEGIGVAAAMVVLLVAFGSLLAMGLPIATALFGIGGGLSLIALIGHVVPAPSFSPVVAAMIGLGVGIDYALFIVTRFRSELNAGTGSGAGAPPSVGESSSREAAEDAAVEAMRTAGHSVLVAGITVVIGMLGLLVLQQQLLSGVAIAGAATVAITVLAALTLLPALIAMLEKHWAGTRLVGPSLLARLRRNGRREPGTQGSGRSEKWAWSFRWARLIQRHRIVAAVAAVAVTLILAAPALAMRLSMPDESAQARGTMGYASYAAMAQGFGPGFDAPLVVVTRHPAQITGIESALARTPGIASVTPPVTSRDGQAAMLVAYPTTGEQDAATNTLANHIESSVLPRDVYLTGPNAGNVTFTNMMGSRLPWLVVTVVGLSMVLLLVVFRSVVIPVKAALMNLLSVTAAYGVLTAITQWGWGGSLFGFPERMPVTTWVPVFLFVILFGLSMDYEVFLLSRMQEAYRRSGDNSTAVARGLATTARVISAAAAIMIVVFCAVIAAPDVGVKQIGLGLAIAVFIDATVVRLVLVPALMELLGKANWWLPAWLANTIPGTERAPRDSVAATVTAGTWTD